MREEKIIFKKDFYFRDVVFSLIFTVLMAATSIYYAGFRIIIIAVILAQLLFTAESILRSHIVKVIISDEGIAARFMFVRWSFLWSEIREWFIVEDVHDNRVIRFRASAKSKIYSLPIELINNKSRFQQTEEFFRKHCGAPANSGAWIYKNTASEIR